MAEMEAPVWGGIGDNGIYDVGSDRPEVITGRLLAQADVKLALVESATAGEVARLLRSTPEGAGSVVAAYVVDGPAALARVLGLSAAKIDAFGWVSEMVAAESAATLIDTYEGGWGLAILGQSEGAGDVCGEPPGEAYIALGTPDTTAISHYPYGGGTPALRWVTLRALDLLCRQAAAKLESTRRVP